MDDKEKEKFGVIIDKEKQPESDQPKVDESVPRDQNLTSGSEESEVLDVKTPENENYKENIQ